MLKSGAGRIVSHAQQLSIGAPPSGGGARSIRTRVAVLADTFGMSAVSIYNWLKRDRVDRGEELGQTTDQQLELAAAKRRIAR
jgi:hypothetical protein